MLDLITVTLEQAKRHIARKEYCRAEYIIKLTEKELNNVRMLGGNVDRYLDTLGHLKQSLETNNYTT